jgi:hypothetical protein
VVATVVVHWILGWHRLVDDWSHGANLAGEVALIVLGAVMVAIGWRRVRARPGVMQAGSRPG